MKSTHKCEVVEVHLEKHPNADTLSIVRPFGYTVIVKTDDWKNKKLGAYVVPDSVVNTNRPEFAFLKTDSINPYYRVKVKKFRNIYSQGLLIPAPDNAKLGDNLADYFEITRYEESLDVKLDTDFEKRPDSDYGPTSKYDIDSFYRYKDLFTTNETLLVTEKIDGSNAFFTCAPVPWVPIVDEKTFTFDELLKLADGPSLIPNANHIREGVVVEPLVPRFNDEIGRVKLKIVSNNYLDKN